ncbi:MAG: cytochrome b/b6 domain-containing protein [Pseudomonadota bacterium]
MTLPDPTRTVVHPAWLRVTHWLNVLAVLVMITSGWRIYNASPIFGFEFPAALTLGGWLGGALLWHFAAMWLLVVNGIIYLTWSVSSGRFRRQLFPLSPRSVVQDLAAALRGRLSHADLRQYNAVQKFAYLFVIADLVLLVLSGLVVFKPVQFPLLRTLMGDFDNARIVHFVAMAGLVGFVVVHVLMAALVPRTILAMVRGR